MIDDSFRLRYKNVPAAISVHDGYNGTPLHNHDEIELLMIDKGSSHVRVGSREYLCNDGDMVLIDPLYVHSVSVDPEHEYKHRCICFEASLITDTDIANRLNDGSLHLPALMKNGENTELLQLANSLFFALEHEKKTIELEARAYVSLMIAHLIDRGLLTQHESEARSDLFCASVLDYIHEHYRESVSSKDASSAMSFDQSYFCRRFRKSFGMSFSSYLNMYRVSISRRLLEDKRKSIAEVAQECGFTDPLYFARCFKRHVEMLPSQYRKSQYSTEYASMRGF